MPKAAIDIVLGFLQQVGEVKIANEKSRKKSVLAPRDGATARGTGAVTSRGTVPDKTEHKKTSTSHDIHDPIGHSASSSISETRSDPATKPKPKEGTKSLDDDGLDEYEPLEALKEIYRRKSGELPPLATLETIQKALLKNGIPVQKYVDEIRMHHAHGM